MPILIIGGVTASGKSQLAVEIAKQHNGVIINADSKQIYSSAPMLTAQPDAYLNADVYRLYSYVNLNESYSVADWKTDAELEINKIILNEQTPILLGGSGLYISSFIDGISCIPKISFEVKIKVAENLSAMGRASFCEYYASKDANILKLNVNDTYRITRIAEVFEETGETVAALHKKFPKEKNKRNIKLYLIIPEKEKTNHAISLRLDYMLANGAIDEVQNLRKMSLADTKIAKTIYGIREISDYLDGKITLDEAKKIILTKTIQYAKRQRTWFNNQYKDAMIFTDIKEVIQS